MPLGKIVPSVLPAPNPAISGLVAKLPDVCKKCGFTSGHHRSRRRPHRASLHCKECRTFRLSVSDTSFKFVSKVVEQFGKPTEPILILRGKSEPEDEGAR